MTNISKYLSFELLTSELRPLEIAHIAKKLSGGW